MIVRFGEFELDTRALELRRDGSAVPMEPQVFRLLDHLVENRDRVVSKDELIDAIWDGRIVSDAALSGCINAVRRAVGDDGKRQEVIRTFPRRGFRFVQDVEIVDGAPSSVARPDAAAPSEKPSIAVLPFENMSGDPEQEYFSDGISEDIITALSRVRWFFVTARNSSFSYKGQSADVRQVANDLGVRYVLEGSVRKSADRVRITAQLVDGRSGNQIWADRYDRELNDVFALQDEITQVVVGTIEPELSRVEQERARIKAPENLDAWEAYHRGMWHAHQHRNDELSEAVRLFRRAIELDSRLSPAYSALSETLSRLWLIDPENVDRILTEAIEAGRKAVQIDSSDAAAHCALGRAYMFGGEPEKSVAQIQKSIDLNPSYAHGHFTLGAALALAAGQPGAAIPHLTMARRLSPRDYLLGAMMARQAEAHVLLEQYDQAVSWGKRAVIEDSTWPYSYTGLASALGHLGRVDEGREACDRMRAIISNFSIDFLRKRWAYVPEQHLEHFLLGLRRAGLPE